MNFKYIFVLFHAIIFTVYANTGTEEVTAKVVDIPVENTISKDDAILDEITINEVIHAAKDNKTNGTAQINDDDATNKAETEPSLMETSDSNIVVETPEVKPVVETSEEILVVETPDEKSVVETPEEQTTVNNSEEERKEMELSNEETTLQENKEENTEETKTKPKKKKKKKNKKSKKSKKAKKTKKSKKKKKKSKKNKKNKKTKKQKEVPREEQEEFPEDEELLEEELIEEPIEEPIDDQLEQEYPPGEQDNQGDEDLSIYLSGFMGEHYQKYEKMSDKKKKKIFTKIVHDEIDLNHDETIPFEELHQWIIKKIEEDATNYDYSHLEVFDIDEDKDEKISWKEYESDQKKQLKKDKSMDDEKVAIHLKKEKIRFDYVDQDKDGFITKIELPRLIMPDNFADMNVMAVDHYITEFDIDGDDKITYGEWEKGTKGDPNIDNPKEHFQLHDKNKDNVLTKDELHDHALDNIAAPHVERELRTIFRMLDKNKDKVLSLKELIKGYLYFTESKTEIPLKEMDKTYEEEEKVKRLREEL